MHFDEGHSHTKKKMIIMSHDLFEFDQTIVYLSSNVDDVSNAINLSKEMRNENLISRNVDQHVYQTIKAAYV